MDALFMSFARSDAIDIVVPQPTYVQRLPALAQGPRLPTASFHRHGKLMWYEFDLRTWAALEPWAQSPVALKGLGHSDDLPMWQTVFRKHAGIMIARRMGWWLFDMGGGIYDHHQQGFSFVFCVIVLLFCNIHGIICSGPFAQSLHAVPQDTRRKNTAGFGRQDEA